MSSVINTTVSSGLCCGCGVCVAICPEKNLKIIRTDYGEYNQVRISPCKHECGLCCTVCPSLTTEKTNEDSLGTELFQGVKNISHASETGWYVNCGVGGVSDSLRRAECASGGLASWFLAKLLTESIVDYIVCVHASSEPNTLFEYFITQTETDVLASKGSAYYPNELSKVLSFILEHDGKYAIIALPCQIKAIRLAQKKNKTLKNRICIVAGLACGRGKTARFTDYTAYLSGLKGKPAKVTYRNTDLSTPPEPHKYVFYNNSGDKRQMSHRLGDVIYHSSIFGITACRFCDDLFAELADISFMDAWLPEFTQTEPRGTSIFVSRNLLCSEILQRGADTGELILNPLEIKKVIKSQGGIRRRDKIGYMNLLYKREGKIPPNKRFNNPPSSLAWYDRIDARHYASMDRKCREKWNSVHGDIKKFHEWVEFNWILGLPLKIIILVYKVIIGRFSPTK